MRSGLQIPTSLLGPMRCRCPLSPKVVRFAKDYLSFDQLNVSRADIPCLLENAAGGAARSTQPVTLYITVKITYSNLYNGPPNIPTEGDGSPAEELGCIHLPFSHHQPVETGNTIPQRREEMSPSGNKDPRFARYRGDEATKRMVPNRSNTWDSAVGRIKWVMDTMNPIAEVRYVPF